MKYPATLLCFLFIIYLFWRDRHKTDGHSGALWIPFAWMFFCGSRYVAGWLSIAGLSLGGPASSDEGNPVNAASFFLLIVAGAFVLSRRKIDWGTLITENKWIVLYFLYCGVSIAWSDYSFIALKRWIKDLGIPIMVLVILTEERPFKALGFILKRLAFLWLPISVLFIKYYPWGREFTPGGMSWGGISGEKNSLGMICLILGIYFCWNFLLNRKKDVKLRGSIIGLILVGMCAWLLYMSRSATSLGCLAVAIGLFVLGRTTFMVKRPGRIIALTMTAACLFFVLDSTLGISDIVIRTLGRDATLTNRTFIWELVKEFGTNPFVGTGYQSFWAGDRLPILWAKVGVGINQAHNGYLEQYLNLGYVGVVFIGIIMLSGLLKVRRYLNVDYPVAILRLCFVVTAVLYNYTEASFYGLNNMWLLTLLAIIEIPSQHEHGSAHSGGTESWSRMK